MRIAFVFPGQGAQSVGMLGGFAGNKAVEETMARADAALGFSLSGLIASGPAEALALSVNTQPAMLASSVAFYEAWRAAGGAEPAVMAGHSLGEWSALTAAGAFPLEEAVRLVRFRAEAMQAAVPVGAGGMTAIIGLSDGDVEAICREASAAGVVEPVNYNSPGQVVIAGEKAALEKAAEIAKARGCRRAIPLAVSGPFHSSMMKPAAEKLAARLEATPIAVPAVPVFANADNAPHGTAGEIRTALVRQLYSPVRWTQLIGKLKAEGVTDIVECGPGRVLTGLLRRTAPEIAEHNIYSQDTLEDVLGKLQ